MSLKVTNVLKRKIRGTLENMTSGQIINVYWVTNFGIGFGKDQEIEGILIEPQNMVAWNVAFLDKAAVYWLKYDETGDPEMKPHDQRCINMFLKYQGVRSEYMNSIEQSMMRTFYEFHSVSNLEVIEGSIRQSV